MTRGAFDPRDTLAHLARGARRERLVHVRHLPRRVADLAPWPEWTDPGVYAAWSGAGVTRLWTHQAEMAELARARRHTVCATGTASGKSLGFLLPVLTALAEGSHAPTGRGATALYLAPTKALAGDQLARLEAMAVPGVRAAVYDGDTPTE